MSKFNVYVNPLDGHSKPAPILVILQVHYSEARQIHVTACFSDLMAAVKRPGGLHPKMAAIVESVFSHIENVGGDIGRHKQKWLSQQTWKDSTGNTMYLD
jgi:hypothetical protein